MKQPWLFLAMVTSSSSPVIASSSNCNPSPQNHTVCTFEENYCDGMTYEGDWYHETYNGNGFLIAKRNTDNLYQSPALQIKWACDTETKYLLNFQYFMPNSNCYKLSVLITVNNSNTILWNTTNQKPSISWQNVTELLIGCFECALNIIFQGGYLCTLTTLDIIAIDTLVVQKVSATSPSAVTSKTTTTSAASREGLSSVERSTANATSISTIQSTRYDKRYGLNNTVGSQKNEKENDSSDITMSVSVVIAITIAVVLVVVITVTVIVIVYRRKERISIMTSWLRRHFHRSCNKKSTVSDPSPGIVYTIYTTNNEPCKVRISSEIYDFEKYHSIDDYCNISFTTDLAKDDRKYSLTNSTNPRMPAPQACSSNCEYNHLHVKPSQQTSSHAYSHLEATTGQVPDSPVYQNYVTNGCGIPPADEGEYNRFHEIEQTHSLGGTEEIKGNIYSNLTTRAHPTETPSAVEEYQEFSFDLQRQLHAVG